MITNVFNKIFLIIFKKVLLLSILFISYSCEESAKTSIDKSFDPGSLVYLPDTLTVELTAGQFILDDKIEITIKFDRNMYVTDNPRIPLSLDSGTVYADYKAGGGTDTLVFEYTVTNVDYDVDGFKIDQLPNFDQGLYTDSDKNDIKTAFDVNVSTVLIDGIIPTLQSLAVTDGAYIYNDLVTFTATFNEPIFIASGTPYVELDVGGNTVLANYVSGSGTDTLIFTHTITITDLDLDGIGNTGAIDFNSATMKDFVGNVAIVTFSTNMSAVTFDGIIPLVSSVTPPADGLYKIGDTLSFTYNFSEIVNLVGSGLETVLNIDSTNRNISYSSGSGSTNLIFDYTIVEGDNDLDGISMDGDFSLIPTTTLRDTSGNDSLLTFTAPDISGITIDGIRPTLDLVNTPANATYIVGSNLDFTLDFSEVVTVTGSPRIAITLGGSTAYANYVSGTGTANLLFRYTVALGEYDTDGIAISNSIDMNGGDIVDPVGNQMTLTYTAPTTPSIIVDGIEPTITSITPPTNNSYIIGEDLDFIVNYDEAVVVAGGSPRIQLAFATGNVYVDYVSGSGTNAHTYRYTVVVSDEDQDGVQLNTVIDENGATLLDVNGNISDLTFTSPTTTSVIVDGVIPTISSVAPPGNDTYILSENLDFTVATSEAINVVGTPRIEVTLATGTVYADYLNGTGTNSLVFRYTNIINDLDTDGITLTTPIDLNTGTLKDLAGNDLTLTYTLPTTTGVLVDAVIPSITNMSKPSDATYGIGENLDFTATFDDSVHVSGGTPRIEITLGSGTVYADYISGTGTTGLVFRYTVLTNDFDSDGLALNTTIDLNGSAIQDVSGNDVTLTYLDPGTSGLVIDGIPPSITSVTPPSDTTYIYNENLDFVVNFDDIVNITGTPQIDITLATGSVTADYLSGTGSSAITFRYTVSNVDSDLDGIVLNTTIVQNGGTLQDVNSNDANLGFVDPGTGSINIDGIIPSITSVTLPTDMTYKDGDDVDFVFNTNDNVNVTGTPRIAIVLTSGTVYADYLSGTGSSALTFRYSVGSGDLDLTGGILLTTPVDLNGGTIKDGSGNDMLLPYTLPNTSNIFVDGVAPLVTGQTDPVDGTYLVGNNLDFTVSWDDVVQVSGTPRLEITLNTGTVYADYLSGDNSNTLTFRYTIALSDQDLNGIGLSTTIDLNGGTILDNANNPAQVVFSDPGTSAINVDAIISLITSVTPPSDKTYLFGENLDFVVNFDDNITVTGTPQITITLTSGSVTADYLSGTGTNALTFRYSVGASDIDLDGIVISSPVNLNGGGLDDSNGYSAILTYTDPGTTNINVDGIVPSITSITPPIDGQYKLADNLDFILNFDQIVNLVGTPRLELTLNTGGTVYADYLSGTSSTAVTFRYTVGSATEDTDGITLNNTLDLNSGTVKDASGNDSGLTFTLPGLTNVQVDGTIPTISSFVAPGDATYSLGDDLDFVANFSENVDVSGTPRVVLFLDTGGFVYADYLSGSGTTALTFRYSLVSGVKDLTGITLTTAIDLNGGTILDSFAGNTADINFVDPGTSGILIDGLEPSITNAVASADATYDIGDTIDFTLTFSELVNISGSPRLTINLDSGTVYADYLSGSSSTSIIFRYTVGNSDLDADGLFLNGSVDLNGGSIQNANGNDSLITFSQPSTLGLLVDGVKPLISLVTPPVNNTYMIGNNLDFTVSFDDTVVVTGAPRISIVLDTGLVYADYLSGSNSTDLVFRYTLASLDNDVNGVGLTSPIDLNSGSIKDVNTNDAVLTFSDPGTTGILIDGIQPSISSVTPAADAIYYIGQNLDFIVNFSENVDVTGTPRISITLASGTVYADYLSGDGTSALTFRYTVASLDNDTNGIVLSSPLDLNGGTINDSNSGNIGVLTYSVPNTSGIDIDGIIPSVSSVSPPANTTHLLGDNLDFTINYNDNVDVVGSPRLTLTLDSGIVYADYLSGSGTSALIFRYTLITNDLDTNGIGLGASIDLNGGTLKDSNLNNADLSFSVPVLTSVLVDAVIPSITGVTPTGNGTYKISDDLDFSVSFTDNITVSGTPRISITLASGTVYADYLSGTGSSNLVFRYSVASSDLDTDGIVLSSPIDLNSGSLKDASGNDVTLTYTLPNTSLINIDGINGTISSVTPPADATYILGDNLNFVVNFSENINVTGTPRIAITLSSGTVYANYLSGTGTNAHTYRYSVASNDLDLNGISLTASLDENSGSILDTNGNTTVLTFTDPGTSSINIDAVVPTISSVSAPAGGTYIVGQDIDFNVSFSDNITVSGSPRLAITLTSGTVYADYLSGSGGSTLVFRYSVSLNDLDSNGIDLVSPIDLNSGSLKDNNGNDAVLTYSLPTTTSVLVDAVVPSVSSVTTPSNGTYIIGDNLDFTFNLSDNVDVTGSPRVAITLGSGTVYADYLSGSSSSALVFRYTVSATDLDTDGIALVSPIDLNGGTLKDASLNDVTLSYTPPVTSLINIDGVVATISSLTAPANATYIISDDLDFTATFSEAVTITGTPRIAITFGSGTVYADYLSGSGSSTIIFRYSVSASDLDSDGIVLTSPIDINGGTIEDANGNTATITYSLPTTTGVLIDGVAPTVSGVVAPSNGTYILADDLDFTATFSEAVTITGTPRIAVTLASGTVYADYLSGTGTTSIIFRYTTTSSDLDTDGVDLTSPIDLNGGTIADASGNNSGLTYSLPTTTGVLVDAVVPSVSSVTIPSIGTYKSGDIMDFTVNFDDNVDIVGTPQVQLTLGSGTVYADYLSGTGSSSIVFRYIVQNSDDDTDGITMVTPIGLNGGTILDDSLNAANLGYAPPSTALIFVDGIIPTISSITPPGDNTYIISDNLDFSLSFSEAVDITGSPRIAITLASGTVYADYLSGSGSSTIIFRYSVSASDSDTNGIVLGSSIDLNGGTIEDLYDNDATLTFSDPGTTGILIDGIAPTISGVSAPGNGTYILVDDLDFTATFSEAVTITGTPRIAITLASGTVYADYLSGTGTTSIIFRYTTTSSDLDTDGIVLTSPIDLNGGTIADASGNNSGLTYSLPTTTGVLVDAVVPNVSSVTTPSNGTYIVGDNLDFTFNLSDSVDIVGSPRVAITLGSGTVYADYLSGTGSNALVFRYTVGASDLDTDGIALVSPIDLNGGTLKDASLNNVTLTYTPPVTSLINIDGVVATISSLTAPANATYIISDDLDFTATFSEAVTITGTPRIAITLASGTVYADYLSGSGSSTIIFRYSVSASDLDSDGIVLTSPIDINGGTIEDANGNTATITYSLPTTTGVLVDGVAPTVSSVVAPSNGTYKLADDLDFTATFSEAVTITGTPRIAIVLASGTVYADYLSGSGTTSIIFRYTTTSSDLDTDGVLLTSPIDLNGGTIADASGNNSGLTYSLPTTTGVLVDAVVPSVSSVTTPSNGTYIIGDNLDFTFNLSDNVDVIGSPRVAITLGSGTVYADYLSGSSSSALVFRYTVSATDLDTDGIALVSPIDLNSGTLKDASLNDVTLSYTPPVTSLINIDGVVATISSLTAPANTTYMTADNLDFSLSFSEAVTITGTPRIAITLGSGTVYADYLSGSGSSTIIFRYNVSASDLDTDGIVLTSPVDLNGGTIEDANGNTATITYSLPTTTGVLIDGVAPTVSGVVAPSNGTYILADDLDFTATFSEAVTITGTPRIAIALASGTVYADYLSGTGTTSIIFRYTTTSSDLDTDGIVLTSPIDLNGGTIADASGNNSGLTYSLPTTTAVLVDAVVPNVSSVTTPSNGTYIIGDNLDFTFNLSDNVDVTGSPRIAITLGSGTVYADYLSGTGSSALVFRYTVGASDLDTDGIALVSPIDLNSGTLKDASLNDVTLSYTPPVTSLINIDGVVASISSVTPPSNATYKVSDNLDFVVNYDENVVVTGSPRLTLTLGSGTVYANYNSGSGSSNITYRYTIASSDLDADGIVLNTSVDLNSGTLKDSAGNDADLAFSDPGTTSILVDGVVPTISNLSASSDGTYIPGQDLTFIATFNEAVTISGTPRIAVTLNSGVVYADYSSGTGTSTINFVYTVQVNDNDGNGIALPAAISLNSGTIQDAGGNDATLTFTDPGTTGILVDGIIPSISSVTPAGDATYSIGDNLDFTVNFDDSVNIVGSPRLTITLNTGGTVYAEYLSGTGTSAIIFRYTVLSSQGDTDGISLTTSVDLNSGSISDVNANNATLSFSDPGTTAILVDGIAPSISSVTPPANGNITTGNDISFTVNFDENVIVSGLPEIDVSLNTGSISLVYASGSGSSALVFTYTTLSTDSDNDGVTVVTSIDLSGGTINDSAGNAAGLTFSAPNTSLVNVNEAATATFEWQDNTGSPLGSYDFGTPGTNTTQTFRVANTGTIISGTPTVSITDSGNAHFSIQTDNCTSAIAAGSFCTVDVLWTDAGASGAQSGTMQVTGSPGGSENFTLQGTK